METILRVHTVFSEVKKSRFVAVAAPADSSETALAEIDARRDPGATHNCWAYKTGGEYRFSDDGEPGGTAGRPILSAIESQGIDRVVVLVTRFFGGIKLGAGGLVRAYGGVASECLRTAEKKKIVVKTALAIDAPFESLGSIHFLASRFRATKRSEVFGEAGVIIEIDLAEDDFSEFSAALSEATSGKAKITR
jgi:uncharacterized YigZ family protein